MDGTCILADIRYPTDLALLKEAPEKTAKYIGVLYKLLHDRIKKSHTYRRVARKECLKIAKMQ